MKDAGSAAWGYGIATITTDTNTVLDTWFPKPHLGEPPANFDPHLIPTDLAALEGSDDSRGIIRTGVTTPLLRSRSALMVYRVIWLCTPVRSFYQMVGF